MADPTDSETEKTLSKLEAEILAGKVKWKNRRKMAWVSLAAIIGVTIAMLFAPIPETRLIILKEPVTWFYFSMASVIGMYMGATTYASIKGK